MASTSDFRNGFVFNHRGGLWKIVEFLHVKPGKGPAFVRTKIKNIRTGQVVDETFRAGEKVEEVLRSLSEREAKVLQLRVGLEDGRSRTLEEVGLDFGVTRERIRQIEAKALRKLRHPSRSKMLRDFLD